MISKQAITRAILEVYADSPKPTHEQALTAWWKNPRDSAGLRLTTEGFLVFNLVKIECHKFELPLGIDAKASTLLILDRKMTCPYYLTIGKKPEIYIYGGKQASLFALYGDMDKFLRSIARQ